MKGFLVLACAGVITLLLVVAVAVPPNASADQLAGVNAHLMWSSVSASEQDRQLDLIAATGAKVVRVDIGWSSLEQNRKGTYERWYLDRLDALVTKAERRGLELLLTLTDSPCWASSAPSSLKQGCEGAWWDREVQRYAPEDPRDYADALASLVRRYGDRVRAWEIWNEPNSDSFFKTDDQARDYARIVRAAYPAAKAAHPGATVIAGSLAEAPAEFVEELFQHGIGGHFDAFSIHPYAGDASPNDPLSDEWVKNSFARGVPSVREVLLRHGEDKPIWLTEFGWSTSTIRDSEPWRNGVDEDTQAQYTEQAFAKMQEWDYVRVGIVFELRDERDDPDDRESNFGLVRHDGTLKPAYAAFERAARALSAGDAIAKTPFAGPAPIADLVDRRLRLRLKREARRVYAHGRAAPRARVLLRVYRFLHRRQRYSRRPDYTVGVRVGSSGRFARVLDRGVGHGRWRVTAAYRGHSAPEVVAHVFA